MNLIEEFLKVKEDNLSSPLTIKNYRIDLTQFLPFLFDKEVDKIEIEDLKQVTILKTRDALLQLQKDKGYTITTINRRMASFKALMTHYSTLNGFPNVTHSMRSFNDTRLKEVEFIPNHDVKNIIERAKARDTQLYFIMGMLFNTGLRSAELLSLTVENVYEDCIIVVGKGGKMRRVELNTIAKDSLKTYLKEKSITEGRLLDMSYVTLRRRYASFLKECDIECSRLHTTRRSFASNLIANGASLTDVSSLLGHSTTATLEKHYLGSKTKKLTVGLLD